MTAPLAPSKLGWLRWLLATPPCRILLLGLVFLVMMGMNTDVMTSYAAQPVKAAAHIIALCIAGFAIYIAYSHFIEQRQTSELGVSGLGRELGIGLLVGVGLYTICELALMALGIYRITGLNSWNYMLPAVAMALSSSVFEELLFRGALFLSLERWLGSWIALVVSALVFGLTHLTNPAATLEGALFIAVEAGILLAAAVMLTRRLWLSIGFHLAWNYTQSAIFSGIVSGNAPQQGLIRSTMQGPNWLTGGQFGVESSILALTVCTATGIILLRMAVKRGKIIPPCWQRQASTAASA
ncbi:CPBP family intramembrane glutamic endopeptidase [Chitinibacter tainanensis]|uniref:CPBP family intramembrane glutamic endopeptidase n=1 Tax=Chitinibacter tainanensis TaxID=230667 RepID=UPI0004120AA4|nr:CPBP family intramembrane glutamic endopeptidase [Chitinibacter tainanensis]